MKMTTGTKIFLSILLAALFACVGYLGYRVYEIDKQHKEAQSNVTPTYKPKEHGDPSSYTLFNEPTYFDTICANNKTCKKEVGSFSLGQKVYDMNINYQENGNDNYLLVNDKQIKIGKLYSIVKFKDTYLCVIEVLSDGAKTMQLLDANLNVLKNYNDANNDGFKINGDSIEYTGASWLRDEKFDIEGSVRQHVITENEGQFIDNSNYVEINE